MCVFILFPVISAFADSLVTLNNGTIDGTAIQTNGNFVLFVNENAVFNFPKTQIKEIQVASDPNILSSGRIPNFKNFILLLSKQAWATNLTPIPATVIDKGILKNVPYSSFHCGVDYEANVYGELDQPAGIEIGVYRSLLEDGIAKSNCLKLISSLLGLKGDRDILSALDLKKDLKTKDGLTFEITPSTDEDSYGGWWISVYSEEKLNLARASDKEMKDISISKQDIVKSASQKDDISAWSTNDLEFARKGTYPKISFVTKSGMVVSNADVVSVRDGVSLVWETDSGKISMQSGMARLEDLSEDLRARFGYDAAKTAAADKEERAPKPQWTPDVAANPQPQAANNVDLSFVADSGSSYSGGSRVYVHGYFRKNGTYVHSYTRSYPHSR